MYIRECLEQDWKWCAPWQCTQTLPKCSLLYKYKISWYMRKCNLTHAPKKECTAFPKSIFAKLTFSTALPLRPRIPIYHEIEQWTVDRNFAHGTAICCNPHNSSNWDSRIPRQLGYKHKIFCKKKKKASFYIFAKTWHVLSVGQWMSSFHSVSCKTL